MSEPPSEGSRGFDAPATGADGIDLSSLLMLRQLQAPGKPDVVARIANRFLEETPGRLSALRAATQAGNPGALERAAHALRGIAGTVGAQEMHDLAATLEDLGRQGTTDGAADVVDALEGSLARARPIYEGLTRTVPPHPP